MIRYEVVWNDAHGDTVMFNPESMDHKPYKFTTLGYLIKTDEVGVSMAHDVGQDGMLRDHIFIPRLMVVSERHIKEPKIRAKKKPTEIVAT